MKRFVSIKGVIDNLRQSVNSPSPNSGNSNNSGANSGEGPARLEQDLIETLVPEQFTAELTLRHGFPNKPTALAFDPLQKIMAIGRDFPFKRDVQCVTDTICKVGFLSDVFCSHQSFIQSLCYCNNF